MEKQVYHIQVLMANKLDLYKRKSVEMVNENIKTLQEIYQDNSQPIIIDKVKQREYVIQDKKVFLYKPYNILLSELSGKLSLDTEMLQAKINNLEKALKIT